MQSTTWSQHFKSLPSNDQGNKDSASFSQATFSNLERKERLRNLTESQEYVIATAEGTKKVQLIHSPKNVGGTRIRPEHKVLGLIGTSDGSVGVIVDHESLTNECEIRTPKIEDIKACSTAEEIGALTAPRNGAATYTGSAAFLMAPFLVEAILDADTTDPYELILVANSAAAAFNTLHENDDEFEDATSHAEDFSLWAWGVAAGRITETKVLIRPTDGELLSYHQSRQAECIMPSVATATSQASSADNTAVLNQLQKSMSLQTEAAVVSNELRREELDRKIESEEYKRDKSKRLHPITQNMIKYAASTDGDTPAQDFPQTCRDFFNRENEALLQTKN